MTPAETVARARAHEILGPSLKCTPDHCNALCLRIAAEVLAARRAVLEARVDVWQAIIDETNDEENDDLDGEAACIRIGGWLGEQAAKARAALAELGKDGA